MLDLDRQFGLRVDDVQAAFKQTHCVFADIRMLRIAGEITPKRS